TGVATFQSQYGRRHFRNLRLEICVSGKRLPRSGSLSRAQARDLLAMTFAAHLEDRFLSCSHQLGGRGHFAALVWLRRARRRNRPSSWRNPTREPKSKRRISSIDL